MPKWVCDPIILPENFTWQDFEDAKLSRKWRRVTTKEERMLCTDLTNKCGSCKFFVQHIGRRGGSSYGDCTKGRCPSYRSKKCCKKYEVREDA